MNKLKRSVKISLPTQPNTPQQWEGETPSLTMLPLARQDQRRAPAPAVCVEDNRPTTFKQLTVLAWVLFFSLICYYLISQFVVTAVVIQGRSMVPTLHDGERYFLNRLCYHYREPERGELVVIKDPGHVDFAVKRIIAGPNDCVQLKNGDVYLNGAKMEEAYLSAGTRTITPDGQDKTVKLGRGQFFVLGDNRYVSEDSRYYGAVERAQIMGSISQ